MRKIQSSQFRQKEVLSKILKITTSLLFLVVLLALYAIPKVTETVLAQIDIPMEDVETESSNATESKTAESGLEQMTLKAQLKPAKFLGDSGYYDVKKFGFVTSNGSEICPSNNCKYGVEEGQLSPYGAGYTFEGKLKVTTQEGDTKKSKFYNFRFEFDKTGEEETNGEKIQTLDGRFGIGSQLTHDITNATLLVDKKNPVITFQGERTPSENFTGN